MILRNYSNNYSEVERKVKEDVEKIFSLKDGLRRTFKNRGGSTESSQRNCIRALREGIDLYNYQTNHYAYAYGDKKEICIYKISDSVASLLAEREGTWNKFLDSRYGGTKFESDEKILEEGIFADEHWISVKDYTNFIIHDVSEKNGEEIAVRVFTGREAIYLLAHASGNGWDYTFYNADFHDLDGGVMEDCDLPAEELIDDLLTDFGYPSNYEVVDYEECEERADEAEQRIFSERE